MSGFDDAIVEFDLALNHYLNGDPGAVQDVFSRGEDVTLCNPVGPPCRGREAVVRAAAEPSSHFTGGNLKGVEEVSRFVAPDLGYVVRIERGQAHVDGSSEPIPYALRVTLVLRREGESWKISHRHADPIMAPRPLATAMEQPPA
ncbi:nuclear transport factor 2 family protein [Arthrobacter sp. ISL-85]|nr:nuclear transport factor 2 family protein [Arthrobacter sp. ISL-85]